MGRHKLLLYIWALLLLESKGIVICQHTYVHAHTVPFEDKRTTQRVPHAEPTRLVKLISRSHFKTILHNKRPASFK